MARVAPDRLMTNTSNQTRSQVHSCLGRITSRDDTRVEQTRQQAATLVQLLSLFVVVFAHVDIDREHCSCVDGERVRATTRPSDGRSIVSLVANNRINEKRSECDKRDASTTQLS
jgi:hypothetical protein